MKASVKLLRQVTVQDVRAATSGLDVEDFVVRTKGLLPYVPDVDDSADAALVRALLDVPLLDLASTKDWWAPYVDAGVQREWIEVVVALRVRNVAGSSALAHADAYETAAFVIGSNRAGATVIRRERFGGRRGRILRPMARTLALEFVRVKGDASLAKVPNGSRQPAPEEQLEQLADEVAQRIEPTVGGSKFLEGARTLKALSVLGATLAAACSDSSATRWDARQKVVRFDVYRTIFKVLNLETYFQAARRLFEVDHPHHIPLQVPWPPGQPVGETSLGILRVRSGKLLLNDSASLGEASGLSESGDWMHDKITSLSRLEKLSSRTWYTQK